MFEQLTWSLGMFVQVALVILALVYALRNSEVVHTLIFSPQHQNKLSRFQRLALPAVSVSGLYLLVLGLLWFLYAETDPTALDWAVVVWLIGVMLIGPAAGLLALLPVTLARALFVFFDAADLHTLETFSQQNFYLFTPDFWVSESWIWLQPEVTQLMVAWGVGALAFCVCRNRLIMGYPLYAALPMAVSVQGTYVVSAMSQWGYPYGLNYLQTEALPSTIALSVAIVLFIMTLALARSEYERNCTLVLHKFSVSEA